MAEFKAALFLVRWSYSRRPAESAGLRYENLFIVVTLAIAIRLR